MSPAGADVFTRRAFDVLSSRKFVEALDLSKEDTKLRDRYGRNRSGQSCLLARRLVEAGVPLITVLFMASVMLPLFLPSDMSVDRLVRALIGLTLFQSAYMAEVIRGGLQAIPKGQEEAAAALGMTYWKRMGLIILPQALKMMIPGIVNTFISLFKDTTLVMIIGLFDLLGIVQAALADSRWLGFSLEGYVFAAFMFWIFCFSMSRYSQYLERKLHTGHKR